MLNFIMGVVIGCVITITALNILSKYADKHMDYENTDTYPKKEIDYNQKSNISFDTSNLPRRDINLIESRFSRFKHK